MAKFTGHCWDNLMQLHTVKWGQDDRTKLESDEVFAGLKNLLDKKLNVHWHFTYLERYIAEGIAPFGLRLKLFPHFRSPSGDF